MRWSLIFARAEVAIVVIAKSRHMLATRTILADLDTLSALIKGNPYISLI
jgi:hypothetical protein